MTAPISRFAGAFEALLTNRSYSPANNIPSLVVAGAWAPEKINTINAYKIEARFVVKVVDSMDAPLNVMERVKRLMLEHMFGEFREPLLQAICHIDEGKNQEAIRLIQQVLITMEKTQ